MSEEKMKILKLLEEGKISSEDAFKLLDAVGKTEPQKSTGGFYSSGTYASGEGYASNSNNSSSSSSSSGSGSTYSKSYDTKQEGNFDFNTFTDDLSKRFETFAKNMEPKFQRFTEAVAEKAVVVADKLSKSFSDTGRSAGSGGGSYTGGSHSGGSYSGGYYTSTTQAETAPSSPKPTYSGASVNQNKTFEMQVTGTDNTLNITSLNGDLVVKGYNGDKITLNVQYKCSGERERIELVKLSNKYYLNYDEEFFDKVFVDAYVPEAMFENIKFQTTNGKILVSDIKSEYLSVSNQNGFTELRNATAENLKVECNNGRLVLERVSGVNGHVENFNGEISARGVDITNMKLISFNASISMDVPYFEMGDEYVWVVETSNEKININLPTDKRNGYYIKATSSLGDVNVSLPALTFTSNERSFVEGTSSSFSTCQKKVKLNVETSNAPITIS